MLETILFQPISIIDPLAALGLFYLMIFLPFFKNGPTIYRIAAFIVICGLLGQTFRNLVFIQTGISPTDAEMPLWVFKDYGVAIAIFAAIIIMHRNASRTKSKK